MLVNLQFKLCCPKSTLAVVLLTEVSASHYNRSHGRCVAMATFTLTESKHPSSEPLHLYREFVSVIVSQTIVVRKHAGLKSNVIRTR